MFQTFLSQRFYQVVFSTDRVSVSLSRIKLDCMIENLMLNVRQEIYVAATIEATFAAVLEQLGPHNDLPDSNLMPMKLEAWPGGRWYRDLGGDNGDFWGYVRAIKRPTLLEITGPLFMGFPSFSHLRYRLSAVEQRTLIGFRYLIQNDDRAEAETEWIRLNQNICMRAEAHPSPFFRGSDARAFL